MKKLSIVIPAYNEERTIAQILKQVINAPLSIEREIIVVDNNSLDKTFEIVSKFSNVKLLEEKRPGKGAAVKKGFEEATGDIFIIQDADLEYDPNDYQKVINPILNGEVEAVMGVRTGKRHKDQFLIVYTLGWLGNHVITILTNILFSNNAAEYEGCYKAFTKRLIREIPVKTDGFDYDNELVCKILKRGYKVRDVPISYYPRSYKDGKKINWKHGFLILWTIIKCRFSKK